MGNTHNRETIDIENAGNGVIVRPTGRNTVSVAIRGDATAEYRVDGKEDYGKPWVTGVRADPEYTGASEYDDVITTGWYAIRIQCVSGTGISNDKAEIVLSASG